MGQSLTHSITVTSDTDTSRTLRLRIIYNSTAGVVDSSNSFNLSGSWPNRSNTSVSINIPYGGGSQTIYDQTRTFTKQYGSSQTASFSASLSGINYWGGTIKRSGSATIPARTPGKPSAPGRPSVSSITSSSASASWTAPSNNGGVPITQYTFQRARNSAFTSGLTSTNTGTSRSINMTGLSRATKYYTRVRASNGHQWSDYSSVREFTTLPEVPTMANGGTASVTRNSATISGLSVSDNGGQAPTNVRVQYNTSQSTSGAQVVTRGSWGSVSITGLAANTTYYYRSAAYNSAGWSSYNSWRSFTTLDDAPDDIDTLTVSDIENTGMTFSWQAPNMNGATFQHYAWELSLSETFSTLVTSGTTTSTSRAFTGLTPGTRYYFRVRAVATPNSGGWDSLSVLTTGIAPNSGLRMYVVPRLTGFLPEGELRRNLAPNPSFELDPVTVTTGSGAGPIEHATGLGTTHGDYCVRAEVLPTGTAYIRFRELPVPQVGATYMASLDATVDEDCLVQLQILWYDAEGAYLDVRVEGPYVAMVAEETQRLYLSAEAIPDAAQAHVWLRVADDHDVAGTWLYADALGWELTDQQLPYFDGDTEDTPDTTYVWAGTPHASHAVAGIPGTGTGPPVQAELYTFINGVRKKLRPMYAHDGVVETE